MSLPAITQLPQLDNLRIHGLIKSLASGMIVPIELAERAYRLGNESCHRAMDDLTESLPEEPLNLAEVERITINKALAKCRGDKLQTARMLGIGKTTLYRKVAAYGIQPAHTLVCPSCGRKIKHPRRPSPSSDKPQANPLTVFAAESAISSE
jgi:hypothetical protein